MRRYWRYSSSFFCTPARELSVWRDSSHGSVFRIHSSSYNTQQHGKSSISRLVISSLHSSIQSEIVGWVFFFSFLGNGLWNGNDGRMIITSLARRSYSSMSRSFSWLTLSTLQMRLDAVSACQRIGAQKLTMGNGYRLSDRCPCLIRAIQETIQLEKKITMPFNCIIFYVVFFSFVNE